MIDDDGKLKRKYINKKVNARKENIECLLSFEEFCDLVKEANLKSSDLGFTGNNYVLARINDTGPYAIGNCRFITQKQNADEKVISEASKEASKRNVKKAIEKVKELQQSEEFLVKYSATMEKYWAGLREVAKEKRCEYEKTAHQSYLGKKNSQYGSFWITDGVSNKKWHQENGDIPEGFYRGRVCNKSV